MTVPVIETVVVGPVTITLNTENIAFLTVETVLAILAALTPLGILPAWALILIPLLQADLPLTKILLDDLENALHIHSPDVVLTAIQTAIRNPKNIYNPDDPNQDIWPNGSVL